MQRIAADVGYSETAFLVPRTTPTRATSGSATSARSPRSRSAATRRSRAASPWPSAARGAARRSRRPGDLVLETNGGPVAVATATDGDGLTRATLTSVATWVREPDPDLLATALDLLGWRSDELDPALPPAVGFAGARHLILAARERSRLATLDYPFEPLKALMLAHDLTTIQLVWRESPLPGSGRATRSRSVGWSRIRRPAPRRPRFGGYLRERGEIVAPAHRSRSSRAWRWAGRAC